MPFFNLRTYRQCCFLLLLTSFAPQKGRAQSAGKAMPDGEIETILVGARRMTVHDILDSVAAHRQPDTNPFMLRSTLSMRLYNDTATYFSFEKEVFINRHHKLAYTICTDSLQRLVPDVNTLSLEQQRRQQNLSYLILWDYDYIVNDGYLKEIQSFGRPVYKVDTANTKIVRYHKLDIDRATWTLRNKEWGVAKITAGNLEQWKRAETYDQHEELLQKLKADPHTQMDRNKVTYSSFAGGPLVPVSLYSFDNFSPIAVPMLISNAVENPEGSAFEVTLTNTQITDKPNNSDYHVMRTIGLESIFKSPFSKVKK